LFSKDESLTHVRGQVDGFARFHLRAGRNEISTTSHAVHQRLLVVDIEPRPKAGAHMVGFQVSYTDEERQFHQLDFTNSTQTHRRGAAHAGMHATIPDRSPACGCDVDMTLV